MITVVDTGCTEATVAWTSGNRLQLMKIDVSHDGLIATIVEELGTFYYNKEKTSIVKIDTLTDTLEEIWWLTGKSAIPEYDDKGRPVLQVESNLDTFLDWVHRNHRVLKWSKEELSEDSQNPERNMCLVQRIKLFSIHLSKLKEV